MPELFDANEAWTETARQLDLRLGNAIRPIIEEAANAGYAIRTLAYIGHAVVEDITLMLLVHRQAERVKQARATRTDDNRPDSPCP